MVSIIIPMYGRATYISSCIESVLQQSYKDIEIICVMDGFSKEINEILQNYSNDRRIRTFTIEHKGVAAARNFGLKKVRGEYIVFIDADDILPPNAIKTLYDAIIEKKVDVVLGDYNEIFDSGKVVRFVTPSDEVDDFNSYLESVTLWNRIFRTDFIFEKKLVFNENYTGGDDRIFCADSFLAVPKIFVVHEIVYCWYRHESDMEKSITHSIQPDNFINDLLMWNAFMDKMLERWELRMQDHMRYSCYYILQRFSEVKSGSKKNECFLQMKKLVLRIDWTENEKLFNDIFCMDVENFARLNSFSDFESNQN